MTIKIEVNNRVQIITLNRPEALNSFNDDMYRAVGDALSAAADDDAVSVVIITGEGRAFCAGTDLGGDVRPNPSGTRVRGPIWLLY
jgi:enoyl-CoA hydratase/carnithine racemase